MGTVDASLRSHAQAAGKELSRDVSHTILFYTVGETVRRAVPGHVPYAIHYNLTRGHWAKYYQLLNLYWQPYLDGKASMDEAIGEIVKGL